MNENPSRLAGDRLLNLVAAWLLALAPAAMLAILLMRPVWDVDIFWQLRHR
ncbi:MAG: hypothetical protein LBV50_02920 [Novosphingobium sp.]|nr:hypothetical protein [Novosphingobium sp.]